MTKTRWLGAAAALSILSLVACDVATNTTTTTATGSGEAAQPAAVSNTAVVRRA